VNEISGYTRVAAGNDGLNDERVDNGLRPAGEEVHFECVGNLGMLFVDAAVNAMQPGPDVWNQKKLAGGEPTRAGKAG
jgi:hypothetical protein